MTDNLDEKLNEWVSVGVMRHCQLCREFKWIDNNYLCYDCRKKVTIMDGNNNFGKTKNNLDEKVKEFYECTDQKIDPVVRAIINERDDPEATDKLTGDFENKYRPKMLFLDDRTKRIEAARERYSGNFDLTIVTNAKECLRYLCKQEWDLFSLDHDLDGTDFQNPDDVTSGMEVVRYICKTGWPSIYAQPEIWVHSSNLFAATLMIDMLLTHGISKAYYKRFSYDDVDKIVHGTKNHKPEIVEDNWVEWKDGTCLSCGHYVGVNVSYQCHECYTRELVASTGMEITDYWKMKKGRE